MHVDVFTVQSSVIICLYMCPIDLYCLAATPHALSRNFPQSHSTVTKIVWYCSSGGSLAPPLHPLATPTISATQPKFELMMRLAVSQ